MALAVQSWMLKPYRIPSESMLDTLRPGDRVLVNRVAYHLRDPQRGDVIVFRYPEDPRWSSSSGSSACPAMSSR